MKKVVKMMLSEEERSLMCSDSKIGLLATIDDDGFPHITFISSIQPHGTDQLTAGQFCAGLSKRFIRERSKVGFLIFSPQMDIWRGRAGYEKTLCSGPEYEAYNKKPMFRYNSYFGFGSIHYFDLIDISAREKLTMGQIISGALKTRALKPFHASSARGALNHMSKDMFSQIDGLKFVSYIDADGYPVLIPAIQAANAGSDRILFSFNPYGRDLAAIPDQADVAVLFVNLKMESVMVKGSYSKGKGLIPCGFVEINRVYNSMPPQPGYIYPRENHHPRVVDF
jgi:nitroimidazol reductase NimA-like FMN-containing flavoprotein (pyridoxamine 5'-phosphate oxidase superfamily)